MTVKEIAQDANLPLIQASLAKKRDFDLPFKMKNKQQETTILNEIKKRGLKYTIGGRYYHILGDNNKCKAVKIVSELYKRKYSNITTIALGDSENDFPMLEAVDHGYLVQKKNGSYASKKYHKAKGIGPEGWNNVILKEMIL